MELLEKNRELILRFVNNIREKIRQRKEAELHKNEIMNKMDNFDNFVKKFRISRRGNNTLLPAVHFNPFEQKKKNILIVGHEQKEAKEPPKNLNLRRSSRFSIRGRLDATVASKARQSKFAEQVNLIIKLKKMATEDSLLANRTRAPKAVKNFLGEPRAKRRGIKDFGTNMAIRESEEDTNSTPSESSAISTLQKKKAKR